MSNSTSVLSVSETMAMLMESMGRYVYYRTTTVQGKQAFRLATKQCISFVSCGFESLDMIKARIKGHRDEADIMYPKRMFNKRLEERRCHNLAIDQALSIVDSIEARFIIGHLHPEPRHNYTIGVYSEDENLFR